MEGGETSTFEAVFVANHRFAYRVLLRKTRRARKTSFPMNKIARLRPQLTKEYDPYPQFCHAKLHGVGKLILRKMSA